MNNQNRTIHRAATAAVLLLAATSPLGLPTAADAARQCFGQPVTLVGTSGGDTLEGTSGDDVIAGGRGKDVIIGRGGNDKICGEEGPDSLIGGWGRDRLSGQQGNDTFRAGPGSDWARGDLGDDRIHFGSGDDGNMFGASSLPEPGHEMELDDVAVGVVRRRADRRLRDLLEPAPQEGEYFARWSGGQNLR